MAIMSQTRSPVPWMGGKHYSASRIIKAFPLPESYDVYVDLFGGAAHVLLAKPPYKHLEVYNDINEDLVNFWMQCRDHRQDIEERCRSLPYSRALYYQYHASLFGGSVLEPLERAVRWFYVLRSNFNAYLKPTPCGWCASSKDPNHSESHAYHSAIDLFVAMQKRFQHVMIDNRDFAYVFDKRNKSRTLFYVDPPYVDAEHYYQQAWTEDDHRRLASLLNATPAFVALSYYPHPLLDELYPLTLWRRMTWQTYKHSQRGFDGTNEKATEMLLMNYAAAKQTLWDEESES